MHFSCNKSYVVSELREKERDNKLMSSISICADDAKKELNFMYSQSPSCLIWRVSEVHILLL